MADWATPAVLGRFRVEPRRGRKTGEDPSIGVATGPRRRRAPQEGAWVTELPGLMDLVRLANRDVRHRPRRTTAPERPHPGAQLRFTDAKRRPAHRARDEHEGRAIA